jgi:3-carboxy-cis,cis-muconate cycloisomerase
VIPAAAGNAIASQCNVAHFDLTAIEREAESAGNEAIPTIDQLRAQVAAVDETAATFVHWGATSQDAIDTALVLALRDALGKIDERLVHVIASLADLAELHAATPMVGRTLLQEAAPTTFGFKVAGWLDALLRHRARLTLAGDEARFLQFGGAVGNLAALGDDGPRIAAALAAELKLTNPDIPWHANRDRLANVATTLAATIGTLGKMARDISLLAQSEIAEVREPGPPGRGRSSTMPQKRNPIGCAGILAAAVRAPGLAATMLSAMPQEHERGLGGWQAEWTTFPELVSIAHGAVEHAAFVAAGLEVDSDRMAQNIVATEGMVFAEAVSFALSARLGRARAREIVGRAIQRSTDTGSTLRAAVEADGAAALSDDELDRLFDARQNLGVAEQAARRVAALARASINGAR